MNDAKTVRRFQSSETVELSGDISADPPVDPTQISSLFVALLPQLEQQALFAATNFDRNIFHVANATTMATGIATLLCPSDDQVGVIREYPYAVLTHPSPPSVAYRSYSGNSGTYLFGDDGLFRGSFNTPPVRLAEITDGTSQTMLFAEGGFGVRDGSLQKATMPWCITFPWTSTFYSFYSINGWRLPRTPWDPSAASSYHPGGCNFAFMDGSVHFLKDTIDSWRIARVWPVGVSFVRSDGGSKLTLSPAFHFGVYQSLSTRTGGEVISANAF